MSENSGGACVDAPSSAGGMHTLCTLDTDLPSHLLHSPGACSASRQPAVQVAAESSWGG